MAFPINLKLCLLSQSDSEQGRRAIDIVLTRYSQSRQSNTLLAQPRVGYLASEPEPERFFFNQTQALYQELGANLAVYLDLETGFSQAGLQQLLECDAIHLAGGDTYRFLHSMKARGVANELRMFAEKGGVIIGLSAGAMLLTPSIESAALCGDSNDLQLTDFSALNLVPFGFVPHVPSQASEKELASYAANAESLGIKQDLYLCADNQAVVILDGELIPLNSPRFIST